MYTSDQTTSIFTDLGTAPVPVPTPGLHGRTLERVSDGLHRVMEGNSVRGYIEEAGTVFVSLAGDHYGHAVEIAQSLTLERAVLAFSLHR